MNSECPPSSRRRRSFISREFPWTSISSAGQGNKDPGPSVYNRKVQCSALLHRQVGIRYVRYYQHLSAGLFYIMQFNSCRYFVVFYESDFNPPMDGKCETGSFKCGPIQSLHLLVRQTSPDWSNSRRSHLPLCVIVHRRRSHVA